MSGSERDIMKHSFDVVKDGIKFFAERPFESIKKCADTIQESVENHIMTHQGLQNLYAKREFRLIQVTKGQDPNVPPRMQLVCPAENAAARQDLESRENGYYCISHCWGPEEELVEWNDSNIVGVKGELLPVQVRSKKCDRLLDLLKTHGGYWWIDIFCAHGHYGKPPLEFMDDIYRHCKQCFALLDCPKGAIDTVASHISGSWPSIDLLPIHNKSNEVAEKYIEYVGTKDIAATSFDMLIKLMVETVYPGVDRSFAPAVSSILQCPWYSRVWTLQEATLPGHTVLMEEDVTSKSSVQYDYFVMIVDQVHRASVIAEKRLARVRGTRSICSQQRQRSLDSNGKSFFHRHFSIATIDRARKFGKCIKLLKVVAGDAYYPLILLTLSATPRRCQYNRDYIFGVLGILDIRIPYTEDLKVLWKDFLTALKPLLPKDSELPWHYDLAKASSLDDVFESFQPEKLLDKTDREKYLSPFFLFP